MAGFSYFTPVAVPPTLAKIREWGLGYAFATEPAAREAMGAATPTGGGGFTFADERRLGGRKVKIAPGQQTWRKMPRKAGEQEIWVGYWNDSPPTPEDLARPVMLSGYSIALDDGHEWRIPAIRDWNVEEGKVEPALPCVYDVDADGQLVRGAIKETHRWLWEATEDAWNDMVAQAPVSDQDLLELAGKIVSANYAANWFELIMLGALSPDVSPVGLVALAIGWKTWNEWNESQKKTNPEGTATGSSSSPGEAAELPATGPLAPIT